MIRDISNSGSRSENLSQETNSSVDMSDQHAARIERLIDEGRLDEARRQANQQDVARFLPYFMLANALSAAVMLAEKGETAEIRAGAQAVLKALGDVNPLWADTPGQGA